jgi:hypothetical protein
MKVKELIELLQTTDPERMIFLSNTDPTDYTVKIKLSVDDITLDGDILGDEEHVDPETESEYVLWDDKDKYIGPTVVLLNLNY